MNAITRSAAWREKSRLRRIVAFVRDHMGGVLCCLALLALMLAVGGMEYADAVRLEGMR